ncbi:MAG: hypothetical protein GY928_24755 [Colwellia sp.]|nr:hypothetical protein [Colwellia sp.]
MSNKEKKVNYTAAQTAHMVAIYTAAADTDAARSEAMDEIQRVTGRSIPSIRAKLNYEGVYIAKAKPEPKGKTGDSKAEILAHIQDATNEVDGFFDSLEGANKAVLNFVLDLVTPVAVDEKSTADQ